MSYSPVVSVQTTGGTGVPDGKTHSQTLVAGTEGAHDERVVVRTSGDPG